MTEFLKSCLEISGRRQSREDKGAIMRDPGCNAQDFEFYCKTSRGVLKSVKQED